jgi:hypothetical protein
MYFDELHAHSSVGETSLIAKTSNAVRFIKIAHLSESYRPSMRKKPGTLMGKVALITGPSKGIGTAMARLSAEGACLTP